MLRYYVFFYLSCASVTLYIGYRDIVLYEGEPPAGIEDQGGSEDTGGGRRKRRDVGDSRVLGFELLLQKLEELRRVTALLQLQKLQQHNPETFRQKAKLSKKKKEQDEKMANGQSSMNPDQSQPQPQSQTQTQTQSQPSKSPGRQNHGKPEESGGYPGSSRGKKYSDRRGRNSRKKRQIIDKLKAGLKNAQNNQETEKGGIYLQVNECLSVA